MSVNSRTIIVFAHDLAMVVIAWMLAWFARFNFSLPPAVFWEASLNALPFVIAIQCAVNWRFGLYRGLWRFASLPDLWNIFRAAFLGVVGVILFSFVVTRLANFPRSILVFYPVFLVFFLGGSRLGYRFWKDRTLSLKSVGDSQRVLVIGAGRAGETIVRDLLRDTRYTPVGFLDDSQALHKSRIQGVPVLGELADMSNVVREYDIYTLLIAIPSASKSELQKVVGLCEETGKPFRMLPRFQENVDGRIELGLNDAREVSIDDLLGREKIVLEKSEDIANKKVLVTGGGGSIGSELCRQIASLNPGSLMVFDQSEFNLYSIERDLLNEFPDLAIQARLGDVYDKVAVEAAFKSFQPDIVFHAAAYKHVPMLQNQVREALRNNVIGTKVVADMADRYHCEKLVLISTDKAVNPSSIMGATKRLAEMVCEARNTNSSTRYITVRFGNVLGSAGSVVPLFQQQIADGGPVTVTHKDMTRFFMTIPEACQLILKAGSMGKGGEIFILDMGEPVAILYLAEQMIRLSGKQPGDDIPIEFTGLRPGEKLSEELFHQDENLSGTDHKKILLARQRRYDCSKLEEIFQEIKVICRSFDEQRARNIIHEIVPELQGNKSQENQSMAPSESNIIEFELRKDEN